MSQFLLVLLQAAFSQFQHLDGQMNRVAARVVHLGDQLEAVNTPRARAAEAHTLMMHFARYLTEDLEAEDGATLLGDTPQQVRGECVYCLHLIAIFFIELG